MRKSEPLLDGVIEKTQPFERTLKLRELQTSYVYTTVLAKKCRVERAFSLCSHITVYLPKLMNLASNMCNDRKEP